MTWLSNLLKLAPTIGTAIAPPLGTIGGAALEFLGDKLGLSDKTQDNIVNTIQGLDPLKAKELDIQYQEFLATNANAIALAQIATNTEEAKSTNWFVSGARPATIWICNVGLLYATVFEPTMRFTATVLFKYAGTFPVIDTTLTSQLLFALLGVGVMRSYDKKQGTAT
jgi:hypothetical protein